MPKRVLNSLFLALLPVASLVLIFRSHIGKLITDNDAVVYTIGQVVAVVILVQLMNAGNQIYRSLLNAIQDEKWLMIFSACLSVFTLLSIYITSIVFDFGLIGVYASLGVSYAVSYVWCKRRFEKVKKRDVQVFQNTVQKKRI